MQQTLYMVGQLILDVWIFILVVLGSFGFFNCMMKVRFGLWINFAVMAVQLIALFLFVEFR